MSDIFDPKLKRFGIFGASESGKTTLAKKISAHFWAAEKRPSVVLDPVAQGNWGAHTKVFNSDEKFWRYIDLENALPPGKSPKNCLVIVDDSSVTINRDNELNGVFTVMRHKGHKLLVIGHSGQNLLPQMRQQLQRVFLFQQTIKSVEIWRDLFIPEKPTAENPATLDDLPNLHAYQYAVVSSRNPVEIFDLVKPT
jgi:hypothetical protein